MRERRHLRALDNAIVVTLAHRDLANANNARSMAAGAFEMLERVLLLESLDRVPVQTRLRGYVLDHATAAASAHIAREALGVQRILVEGGRGFHIRWQKVFHALDTIIVHVRSVSAEVSTVKFGAPFESRG